MQILIIGHPTMTWGHLELKYLLRFFAGFFCIFAPQKMQILVIGQPQMNLGAVKKYLLQFLAFLAHKQGQNLG